MRARVSLLATLQLALFECSRGDKSPEDSAGRCQQEKDPQRARERAVDDDDHRPLRQISRSRFSLRRLLDPPFIAAVSGAKAPFLSFRQRHGLLVDAKKPRHRREKREKAGKRHPKSNTHPSFGTLVLVRNEKRCFVGRMTGFPPPAPPLGISMRVVS